MIEEKELRQRLSKVIDLLTPYDTLQEFRQIISYLKVTDKPVLIKYARLFLGRHWFNSVPTHSKIMDKAKQQLDTLIEEIQQRTKEVT